MSDLAGKLAVAGTRVGALLFGSDGTTPLSTVRFTRAGGIADDDALNLATGEISEPSTTTVYEGAGVIRPVNRMQQNGGVLDGQQPLPARDPHYEALLPMGVPDLQTGDVGTVLTSVIDSKLVGRRFLVAEDMAVSAIGVIRTVPLEAT